LHYAAESLQELLAPLLTTWESEKGSKLWITIWNCYILSLFLTTQRCWPFVLPTTMWHFR